jgi:hypothetical protein
MKFQFIYLIAFLSVCLLFFLSMGCSCAQSVVPYRTASYAAYEGFTSSGLQPYSLNGENPEFNGFGMDTNSNLLDSIQQKLKLKDVTTTESPSVVQNYSESPVMEMPTPGLFSDISAQTTMDMPTQSPMNFSELSLPTESSMGAEGFELQGSTYSSETKPIDSYSALKGSLTCDGYGYHNSMGSLCLDQHTRELLKTRGGNQTVRESQIA